MAEKNETDPGAPPAGATAKANLIRAAILVVLLGGLGFAVMRMMEQQKRNREIMDINRPNPNEGGSTTPAASQAEVMKAVLQARGEIQKAEKEAEAKKAAEAAPAAPAEPAAPAAPAAPANP